MASVSPFLIQSSRDQNNSCLLCNKEIKKKDKTQELGEKGLESLKVAAERWRMIDIPVTNEKHHFTEVSLKLSDVKQRDTLRLHASCRTDFRNRIDRFEKKYGTKQEETSDVQEQEEVEDTQRSIHDTTRITRSGNDAAAVNVCFVCNKIRTSDKNWYREGGLTRCSSEVTAKLLVERKEIFLNDPSSRLFEAAKRLDFYLSGQVHDIFAADVCYHNSCYIKFALSPISSKEKTAVVDAEREDVKQAFYYNLRRKILRDREAFLLNELLEDVQTMSEENGLDEPVIKDTKSLRRCLEKEFGDDIGFFPSGKFRIVHSADVNPCEYSVATLKGRGLRDADLVKSFARMIRRKTQATGNATKWPLTPDEMISMLDEGPVPELYNAIYYTMNERGKENAYGYAITKSNVKATKIWSFSK